ncbi:MAG: hypothetical protein MI746_07245 [Pseudomonadales bacterium]|nr:hypothetical protein [Pseudomonadales bacterium]
MLYLLVGLLVVLFAFGFYYAASYNSRTVQELQENPQGEQAQRVMLLTLPTGRTVPVNYLREGNTVFAASDFSWWKQIARNGSSVEMLIQGNKLTGVAQISLDDEYTYDVFTRLRPDAPTWASRLMRTRLVVITLE